MHIADKANTISWLCMDSTSNVSEDIMKGLKKSLFQNNTDLGTYVGECFANTSEAVEDIVFLMKAQIAHE